ncbi:MAG: YgiT-type zinc finger protein [Acidobacteriota bacterium]
MASGIEVITLCDICEGATTVKSGQSYHYKECGLDNVYLENMEVVVCENCGVITPILPRITLLHATIARAIALQPYPLSGADIRYLRKQLGLSAKQWAVLLRIDHATLLQWENGDQTIGSQSDALIRLLYFRVLEEKENRHISEPLTERIAASRLEPLPPAAVLINVNNPSVYWYQSA